MTSDENLLGELKFVAREVFQAESAAPMKAIQVAAILMLVRRLDLLLDEARNGGEA